MSASPFHNSRRFAGKRLHLGVCGSIACYKALDLLRALHALDIHVSVTLTDGARRFVTPLLFEALGAMPVYGRMFEGDEVFDHLEPGQRAQAMLVAPASTPCRVWRPERRRTCSRRRRWPLTGRWWWPRP